MLQALREPKSAAALGRELGVPRQRLNYHLRELRRAKLVRSAGTRVNRNCVERLMRATATTYVVHPSLLELDPDRRRAVIDHFSEAYLAESAADILRDLADLRPAADAAGKRVATLTERATIRFANAAARKAFTDELTTQLAKLVEKYHDPTTSGGRAYQLLAAAWPLVRREGESRRG